MPFTLSHLATLNPIDNTDEHNKGLLLALIIGILISYFFTSFLAMTRPPLLATYPRGDTSQMPHPVTTLPR